MYTQLIFLFEYVFLLPVKPVIYKKYELVNQSSYVYDTL